MHPVRAHVVLHPVFALVLTCCLLSGLPEARALTRMHDWSQRFGGSGFDATRSVAVDSDGNVFAAGTFTGTVNLGGDDLVASGPSDIFLAKYRADGSHLWSRRIGSTAFEYVTAIALDNAGDVIMTGSFSGIVDFGGGGRVAAGISMFLAKYSADGAHAWSQAFGNTAWDQAFGTALATDGSNNIAVTGQFSGTVSFGGSSFTSAQGEEGSEDIFLAKYDANGVHQWSKRLGGTSFDTAADVAMTATGYVFLAGTFMGTVSFGGAGLTAIGIDIFIARYSPAGTHQWSKDFPGGSFAGPFLGTDASGNLYAAGGFLGSTDFGGGALNSAGAVDIFLARFNVSGVHQWSQRFGGAENDHAASLEINERGIVVTGAFRLIVNFGGGNLVSAGYEDVFAAAYDADGSHLWSQRGGYILGDQGMDVATDDAGAVLVAGRFQHSMDLGGGTLTSAGDSDAFLARFGFAEPVISSITDVGNDQGRQVRISFERSGHDAGGAGTPVTQYVAYRRIDDLPAAGAPSPAPGGLMVPGWEYVGAVPAFGERAYNMVVPTLADSTIALGQYRTTFFVRAATASSATFFDSPADSGYSLDNLSPGIPQNLAYTAGELTWDESNAADFDYFTVYGSNVNSIGAATVVDYRVAPAMNVAGSPYNYYFVTATDFAGNEGRPAVVQVLTNVGGTPSSYVLSVSNHPNPFNPRTTVSFTVPARGAVTVAIYDAAGARVATLLDRAERAAGAYTLEWDGRADSGAAVSSGIYFARIDHGGASRTRKMVLLK